MNRAIVALSMSVALWFGVPRAFSVNMNNTIGMTPTGVATELCQRYHRDLGVAFPGQVGGGGMPGLAGTVQVPQKFVLLGIPKATPLGAYDSNNDNMLTVDDLQVNEPVRFVGQADGNVKITIPRLNREHILLSPANGGWWPMLAEGLGFKPDVLPTIGQPLVAVSGGVARPELLVALGFENVTKGARLELYAYIKEVWEVQPVLADLTGTRGREAELAAVKGAFLGKITIGEGEVALRGMPDVSAEPDRFVAALAGRGVTVALPRVPGFRDRGRCAVLGIITDLNKFAAVGLAGAKVGDHVHLIPRGQDWVATLVLPRGKTTLVRVNDQGAVERVELKQK